MKDNRLRSRLLAIVLVLALASASCAAGPRQPVPPASDGVYSHEGTQIHFQDVGRGRPLVFIHGFGAARDSWRFLADALRQDYRLVLFDLKGHGYSGRPRDRRYALQDHAEIVVGLVNQLKLSNVVLVGHSFGSAVALLAALRLRNVSPQLVSGLVLFAGSVDPDRLPFFLRLMRLPVLGWLGMKLTSASFKTRIALTRAYYDDSQVTESVIEMYAKYWRIPGTDQAMLETAKQFVPPDLAKIKAELKKLDLPVLHLHGDQDIIITRPAAEGVCALLPRCRLVTVADVGHVPQEERPEKIIPLLKNGLAEISNRRDEAP